LKSLRDFQNKIEEKIERIAKIFEICPSLEEKFEIVMINVIPVMTKNGEETFETNMVKYV